MTKRGRLEDRATTDGLSRRVAELQNEAGEGPCFQSMHDQAPVRVDNFAQESRWPSFSPRIVAEPVCSMLALPLFIDEVRLGSLSMYGSAPYSFDATSVSIGLVFASHATVALVGAQTEEGLRQALDHRDVIGQAKGILMERHKLSAQQAFMVLVATSQRTNVKLREIADQLTTTGEIDLV